MSNRCIVIPLLNTYTKEQLKGEFYEYFLKIVSRCKCPDHINEKPIDLPNIQELNHQLVLILSELLDFGIDHIEEDKSGNAVKLVKFIKEKCLSENSESLFNILENLVKLYNN